MGMDQFQYTGKRVLVLGGASGMGAAAAKLAAGLGGEITAMDVAAIDYPVAQSVPIDLRDQGSVDAALPQLDGRFDVVFSAPASPTAPRGLWPSTSSANAIALSNFWQRACSVRALPSS